MTESLFDTNFTNEKKLQESTPVDGHDVQGNNDQHDGEITHDTTITKDEAILPSLANNSTTLINYRVLISAKESGCLIGQNGRVIDSIRDETNTKAGISKLLPGSHERILTVSGTLDNCSKALSYFAQALCNAAISSPDLHNYNYFPLKQLSSIANIAGETTILRLLIPNNQMGTLIGSKGKRIQEIQSNFNISMIASKSFLPNSNERLVELQGTVDNLYDSLRIISRCLIEDFSSIVGTNYYVPVAKGSSNYTSNASHYVPSNNNTNSRNGKVSTTLSFNNDIVGALIGKNGSRIQGVRKISGAIIGISDEVEGKDERIFTITGNSYNVEKAKNLLYHNLEREEQRRAEQS